MRMDLRAGLVLVSRRDVKTNVNKNRSGLIRCIFHVIGEMPPLKSEVAPNQARTQDAQDQLSGVSLMSSLAGVPNAERLGLAWLQLNPLDAVL
jgi:hypothetical protein